MTKPKEKSSIEKFYDGLHEDEKTLLSLYLQKPMYESLSDKFDDLLKNQDENKKIND